jgi:hypothetical protein
VSVNREYKDSVFSLLFGESEALRILMYMARIYEKIVETKDVYAKGLIKIPRPEFIVLYNGPDIDWDSLELKLSDAFEDATTISTGSSMSPPLELFAIVYNINQGHNKNLLQKSETLNGYSIFIDKVREFDQELDDLSAAIKKAVDYCVDQNILKSFLEKHSSEVINMLFAEWKEEEALEYRYEEGREEAARNMLKDNLPVDAISRYTGLSIEAIPNLEQITSTQTL